MSEGSAPHIHHCDEVNSDLKQIREAELDFMLKLHLHLIEVTQKILNENLHT